MSEINDIEERPEGTFLINLYLIHKYQRLELSIRAKYKYGTYQKCSFRGGINNDFGLITCKDRVVIP